jgi:hypothetical protein
MRPTHTLLAVLGLSAGSALLFAGTSSIDTQAAARRVVLQQAERMSENFFAALDDKAAGECSFTATLATQASMLSLQADLSLAIAGCVNEESGTPAKFFECLDEAFDDFTEGLEELQDVHEARLELCALLGGGIYDPDLDEDEFLDGVDHKFLPLKPGAVWVYHQMTDEGLEEITVTVTGDTREVDGIECIVVRDVVTLDGVMIEDTHDWYAQHEDGSVWYMGEIAQNFEDGELTDLDGSWETGVDGGLPGRVMLAQPAVGVTYRQELLLTEAEDAATVLAIDARAIVPAGTFLNCVKTLDFTPLEPGHLEHKFYAKGVGLVLETKPGTDERLELVSFTPGS